jgi:hypothetical protein
MGKMSKLPETCSITRYVTGNDDDPNISADPKARLNPTLIRVNPKRIMNVLLKITAERSEPRVEKNWLNQLGRCGRLSEEMFMAAAWSTNI